MTRRGHRSVGEVANDPIEPDRQAIQEPGEKRRMPHRDQAEIARANEKEQRHVSKRIPVVNSGDHIGHSNDGTCERVADGQKMRGARG